MPAHLITCIYCSDAVWTLPGTEIDRTRTCNPCYHRLKDRQPR